MICLTIQVPNLTKVLLSYDEIRIYRSDTLNVDGDPIDFAEVTTVANRIVLVTTAASYMFTDPDGAPTSWYTVTFANSDTDDETPQSSPSQGVPNYALDIISVQQLRDRFLFGTLIVDDDNNALPDAALAFYIESAVAQAEQILDLPIVPRAITDERHDFFPQEYYSHIYLRTDQYPLIDVDRIRLVLPTGQEAINFPREWIYPQGFSGQIHIIPGNGAVTALALTQASLRLPSAHLPDVFRLNYRAGFRNGKVPANIVEFVGMLASFGPFNIAGDLVLGAGIANQSVSIDAISTSIGSTASATNAGYGARILTYGKKLQQMTSDIRRYYKGVGLIAG